MTAENLWGALPGPEDAESPLAILRAQAKLLGENTDHDLTGKINTDRSHDYIVTELSIEVRALNFYEISLVRTRHEAVMCPVQLFNLLENDYEWVDCPDEATFKDKLGALLRSPKTQKVIASLLAQARNK